MHHLHVKIPDELHERLVAEAAHQRRSVRDVVTRMLECYLDRAEDQRKDKRKHNPLTKFLRAQGGW